MNTISIIVMSFGYWVMYGLGANSEGSFGTTWCAAVVVTLLLNVYLISNKE